MVPHVRQAVGSHGSGLETDNAPSNQHLAIPGAHGYSTFKGPAGKPMAVGQPWRQLCEPIVFSVAKDVPQSVYDQIEHVVTEARDFGVDAFQGSWLVEPNEDQTVNGKMVGIALTRRHRIAVWSGTPNEGGSLKTFDTLEEAEVAGFPSPVIAEARSALPGAPAVVELDI